MAVAAPKLAFTCPEPWDGMAERGGGRHCTTCDKVVHDLAERTDAEVAALLAGPEPPCVRMTVAGGTLVTRTTAREGLLALLRRRAEEQG